MTKATRRKDLVAVLEILRSTPQAYHSQGPEVVLQEMETTITRAFLDVYAGAGTR